MIWKEYCIHPIFIYLHKYSSDIMDHNVHKTIEISFGGQKCSQKNYYGHHNEFPNFHISSSIKPNEGGDRTNDLLECLSKEIQSS
jgi:hypothetical protein